MFLFIGNVVLDASRDSSGLDAKNTLYGSNTCHVRVGTRTWIRNPRKLDQLQLLHIFLDLITFPSPPALRSPHQVSHWCWIKLINT
jgi:hypothetical protein